jgi:hypothetical protein
VCEGRWPLLKTVEDGGQAGLPSGAGEKRVSVERIFIQAGSQDLLRAVKLKKARAPHSRQNGDWNVVDISGDKTL